MLYKLYVDILMLHVREVLEVVRHRKENSGRNAHEFF